MELWDLKCGQGEVCKGHSFIHANFYWKPNVCCTLYYALGRQRWVKYGFRPCKVHGQLKDANVKTGK